MRMFLPSRANRKERFVYVNKKLLVRQIEASFVIHISPLHKFFFFFFFFHPFNQRSKAGASSTHSSTLWWDVIISLIHLDVIISLIHLVGTLEYLKINQIFYSTIFFRYASNVGLGYFLRNVTSFAIGFYFA